MADIPAFYGRLQKQITMKTDRLPPRERGLKPTHFIDVWRVNPFRYFYGYNYYRFECTPMAPDIEEMEHFNIDSTTIAIFKIYPKHK